MDPPSEFLTMTVVINQSSWTVNLLFLETDCKYSVNTKEHNSSITAIVKSLVLFDLLVNLHISKICSAAGVIQEKR